MKLSILSLYLIIFCCFTTTLKAQFYKKISADIGINRSKIFNSGIFYPNQFIDQVRPFDKAFRTQAPAITTNYSMSLGYRIFGNHIIRIRHSRNRYANYLTGHFGHFGFCGLGTSINLSNGLNGHTNKTLGLNYELQMPIGGGAFILNLGYEKQWNNFEDTFVIFPGSSPNNQAVHASIGMTVPLVSVVHLYSKILVTKTFENNGIDLFYTYGNIEEVSFVPIQVGLEIGLRLDFRQ